MKITATYKGSAVTIVDIDVTGNQIYTTYVDGDNVLKTDVTFLPPGGNAFTLAISATPVS